MRRTTLWLYLLLAASAVCATDAPAPKPAEPEKLDMIHQVERLAAGKPLPVALVASGSRYPGTPDPLSEPKPVLTLSGKSLLDALGDIADAFSEPLPKDLPEVFAADAERRRNVFEPYAFRSGEGSVWTIARDRRWEDPPAQEMKDRLAGIPDFELSTIFFRSLTGAQMKTATTSGLRWTDLTDRQKPLWKALLGRPYATFRAQTGPDGRQVRAWVASSETPLPVVTAVLHIYVGFANLSAPTGEPAPAPDPNAPPMPQAPDAPKPGEPMPESYSLYQQDLNLLLVKRDIPWRSKSIPVYDPRMKPSDLAFDLPALSAPIGVRGIMPLGKAVAAAASATKMPLKVDARLGGRDAFVGDAAMRCGDALRLLAFSFDGTWRKVGNAYLLTWDRKGKAEDWISPSGLTDQMISKLFRDWRRLGQEIETPDWQEAAEKNLGPEPGLPLAPTPAQYQALNAPPPDLPFEKAWQAVYERLDEVFGFSRLEPSQQDLLRAAFRDRRTLPTSANPETPFPMEALEGSKLSNPRLLLYVDIPGVGRVNASRALLAIRGFDPMSHPMLEIEKRLVDDAEAKRRKAAETPVVLDYPTKAVAPAPLSAGQWSRLLEQMERKGMDTLYVPVLWDGQTLFPSEHFPLLPICRGEDLLAHVLAKAKPRHIRVVAVLHTLAWRFPESKVHWLNKRPDLVDVDVTGHTRREWAETHPVEIDDLTSTDMREAGRLFAPLSESDFVRPTVPEVKTRLLALARELGRYEGLDGVAIDHWTRVTGSGLRVVGANEIVQDENIPDLGGSVEDRLAFLNEKGLDPLDIEPSATAFMAEDGDSDDYYLSWRKRAMRQDVDLANAVLKELEASFPGRTQVFSHLADSVDVHPPAASVVINADTGAPKGAAFYRQVMPPTAPLPEPQMQDGDITMEMPAIPQSEFPRRRLEYFHAMLTGTPASAFIGLQEVTSIPELPKADGIVLDFTGSPDLLWDGLSMLPNRR